LSHINYLGEDDGAAEQSALEIQEALPWAIRNMHRRPALRKAEWIFRRSGSEAEHTGFIVSRRANGALEVLIFEQALAHSFDDPPACTCSTCGCCGGNTVCGECGQCARCGEHEAGCNGCPG